jgi:succinate-acetate transporter protein
MRLWRVVSGSKETRLDRALQRNRRRLADRVAIGLGALGFVAIVVATVHKGFMELTSSDLVAVGGVLLTGAALMMSLAPTGPAEPPGTDR